MFHTSACPYFRATSRACRSAAIRKFCAICKGISNRPRPNPPNPVAGSVSTTPIIRNFNSRGTSENPPEAAASEFVESLAAECFAPERLDVDSAAASSAGNACFSAYRSTRSLPISESVCFERSRANSICKIASFASGPEKNEPFISSNAPSPRADAGIPATVVMYGLPSNCTSVGKRTSGYTSTTFLICANCRRASSSSLRDGCAVLLCGRGGPPNARIFACVVTNTASNSPERDNRVLASSCNPTPSESIATSEATPTAIPRVVNELRSTASRRLRAASSVRSRNFIGGSLGHQFSIAHGDNPVRVTRGTHLVVRHHHNGHPQRPVYFL